MLFWWHRDSSFVMVSFLMNLHYSLFGVCGLFDDFILVFPAVSTDRLVRRLGGFHQISDSFTWCSLLGVSVRPFVGHMICIDKNSILHALTRCFVYQKGIALVSLDHSCSMRNKWKGSLLRSFNRSHRYYMFVVGVSQLTFVLVVREIRGISTLG